MFIITEEVFKTIQAGTTLYHETLDTIDMYKPIEGGWVCSKHLKSENAENDLIWRDDNLKSAIPVLEVKPIDLKLKLAAEG